MVFHEITKDAIRAAAESPRDLDQRLVDAQEARRIIDRLYGYDTLEVQIQRTADGPIVTKTTRATLPSAAEIEARYDHTRHVNPLLDKE